MVEDKISNYVAYRGKCPSKNVVPKILFDFGCAENVFLSGIFQLGIITMLVAGNIWGREEEIEMYLL